MFIPSSASGAWYHCHFSQQLSPHLKREEVILPTPMKAIVGYGAEWVLLTINAPIYTLLCKVHNGK